MHRLAGGPADGLLPQPHRLCGCHRPQREDGYQRRRGDHRRTPQSQRLRHRRLRQVAFGLPKTVSSPATRLRRVFGNPLLQRHVAQPPREQKLLPAAAAHRGQRDHRHQPRPKPIHDHVNGTDDSVYQEKQEQAFLRLPRASYAARAAVRFRQVQGKIQTGPVRRRDYGTGLEHRPTSQNAERTRSGRKHAADRDLRQRPLAQLRQPRG